MNYAIPSILSPAASPESGPSTSAARLPAPVGAVGPSRRHLPALDGLRGLAILMVLAHNMTLVEGPVSGVAGKMVRYLFDWGWVGVQLFFVLSGFLITGILLDARGSPRYYRDFYVRRALRIFPLHYAVLALILVVLPLFVRLPALLDAERHHQIWLWTFLSNWTIPFGVAGMALPHFWSLAVEEQFYLVWPFLLRRRDPARVLRLCLIVGLLAFVARCALLAAGAPAEAAYYLSVCRMDALAIGGAAAALLRLPGWRALLLRSTDRLLLGAGGLTVLGLLAMHGCGRLGIGNQTVGYSIGAVVFGLLVLAAAAGDSSGEHPLEGGPTTGLTALPAPRRWPDWLAVLRTRPLRSIGKYSYAIYVFHKPLHDYVGVPGIRRLGWNPLTVGVWRSSLYVMGMTAAVYLLAAVSYHGFERHFLGLKRRFSYG